ncbi:hypothetical protein QTP70_017674 [Hemibagrus guttatus]|uniref:Gasdermin pore forming domain-containing protein n=1 Tax=Hemibagrus guttatus TaxID=175788 RepID=A0AAE0PUK8_9TELE|nr:hypothetical protein QTP70_017674 [Hemibagrus guttatus]
MLKEVTRNLLHQTDRDGMLIAVSRLNDSEKLKPLAVVIKCAGTWLWQRTKYRPTDFTLNDLLQGKCIQPALDEKVFLNNYVETRKGNVTGSGEVDMAGVTIKAQGHGASKILSSLGTLHKENLLMPHFLKDSKDRKVDLQHSLIKQIQGKNQIFTVVKERIFTTCGCTINFSELKAGSFSTLLKLINLPMVRLNESVCLQNSRDVAIEIPARTVLAYSVSELNIKSDGHYEVVVSPNGIEADDSNVTLHSDHDAIEVDGLWALTQTVERSPLNILNKDLTSVKATLCELACLTPETRFSLLNLFQEILPDQTLLATLENKLENICDESMYDYLADTSSDLTDKFLDLLLCDMDAMGLRSDGSSPASSKQSGGQGAAASWKPANSKHHGSSVNSTDQRQLILTAMHMLISAAGELTDYSLSLLKTCSSETINGLNDLLTHLTYTSQQVPFSELPFLLRNGEVPEEVEQLFISSNITLKIDNRELHAEIGSDSVVLPLVLCVVIHGLAYLNETCEIDIEI